MPDLTQVKLQDKLLGVLVEHTQFSLLEIGQAYKRLRSFDRLLSCIHKAASEGRDLSKLVGILAGNGE